MKYPIQILGLGLSALTAAQVAAVEPVILTQAQVDATENQLTDFPLMQAVKAAIATRDNDIVAAVTPLNSANPDNVRRLESVFSQSQFEYLFALRAPEYTYQGLLQAAAKFPPFAAVMTMAVIAKPYVESHWQPCLLTLPKKRVRMISIALSLSGAKDYIGCVKWAGMRPSAEVTTWNVTQALGKDSSGPAAHLLMAVIKAILAVGQSSFHITTTMGRFLMPCLVMSACCLTIHKRWLILG